MLVLDVGWYSKKKEEHHKDVMRMIDESERQKIAKKSVRNLALGSSQISA